MRFELLIARRQLLLTALELFYIALPLLKAGFQSTDFPVQLVDVLLIFMQQLRGVGAFGIDGFEQLFYLLNITLNRFDLCFGGCLLIGLAGAKWRAL